MIPVVQRISASGTPDNPSDTPGDCVKAAVASILELPYEDVPHFVAGEVKAVDLDGNEHATDWLTGLNLWLNRRGIPLYARSHENHKPAIEVRRIYEEARANGQQPKRTDHLQQFDRPDWHQGYWIAKVMSENFNDGTHAIVMLDDRVVHDPSKNPRKTPYKYVGSLTFVATDPAKCVPR